MSWASDVLSTGTSAHCCVVSAVAFLSDHEATNATMNAVNPICIEPLHIERPRLSVAQAERIDGSESGASLHGASSSARAEPPAPRRVQSAAGVEWKSRR